MKNILAFLLCCVLAAGTMPVAVAQSNQPTGRKWTSASSDLSSYTGATLDVQLNKANAWAITSGGGDIIGSTVPTGTIAAQVNIGELPKPTLSFTVGGGVFGNGVFKVAYSLTSPTTTETSVSDEATITTSGCSSNCTITVTAPTYPGTATSYSPYATAVGGASWSELKCAGVAGTAIGSNATIAAACSGAAASPINTGVRLSPPSSGSWKCSITDGVSDCVRFFDQSAYSGPQSGEARAFSIVANSSAMNVEAIVATDNNAKSNQGYYKLEGLSVNDVASDTLSGGAVVIIRNTFDTSAFDYLHAGVRTANTALYVSNTCCANSFIDAQLEANSIGQPLKLLNTNDTTFFNLSAVHPAAALPGIELQQGNGGTYFEGTTYTECGTSLPTVDYIQTATIGNAKGPIHFNSISSGAGTCIGLGSTPFLVNVGVAGATNNFSVGEVINGNWASVFKYTPNTAFNIAGVSTANRNTQAGWYLDNNSNFNWVTPINVPTPGSNINTTQAANTAWVNTYFAQLASPAFTGTPTAPTPSTADNTTKIATTAYVQAQGYAPLASPAFTGTPTVPTATAGTNTTQAASTAFVAASFAPLASPTFTGTPIGTTPALSDNSTKLATTAFVDCQNAYYAPGSFPLSDQLTAAGTFATTVSVPSTCYKVGTMLEIHAHGVWSTTATAAPKLDFQVGAGGTTAACPAWGTATTITVSITNGYWEATCYIQINTTGAPGTAVAWGNMIMNTSSGNTANIAVAALVNASTISYTTNASNNVTIQETGALVAGQTFNLQGVTVALRNP